MYIILINISPFSRDLQISMAIRAHITYSDIESSIHIAVEQQNGTEQYPINALVLAVKNDMSEQLFHNSFAFHVLKLKPPS